LSLILKTYFDVVSYFEMSVGYLTMTSVGCKNNGQILWYSSHGIPFIGIVYLSCELCDSRDGVLPAMGVLEDSWPAPGVFPAL
jgi:hypothetical protein